MTCTVSSGVLNLTILYLVYFLYVFTIASKSQSDLSLISCTFVKLQLSDQGTNLYGDSGEFGGYLEIQNQWLYHGTDDTHSHSVGKPSM